VSAAAVPTLAPALPISAFNTTKIFVDTTGTYIKPLNLTDAVNLVVDKVADLTPKINAAFAAAATCSTPRVRVEWESYPVKDRLEYIAAIKCLQGLKSSGGFPGSKSRYEDFASLHQSLTPNVHGNSKFLIWHRYYIWAFEDVLRTECAFTGSIPWFDETKFAGKFQDSSIFSNDYYGSVNVGGNCVTNGKFANLVVNIGPGPTNSPPHCLSRNLDNTKTINGDTATFNACYNHADWPTFASCLEGVHAWGHNGIGGIMYDMYSSPGDPTFFLHHAFIDRQYRIWQNANSNRISTISGTDRVGNPLTLDTTVSLNGLRPTITIRDLLNTVGDKLCYKYNV